MHDKLFEAALGIQSPWAVTSVRFDEAAKVLTVDIDFKSGSRFEVSGHEGVHPVHDTVTKSYRHLNFFQHECYLQVRTPRVKLPNGSVRLVEPDFAGRLSGFTLLFEAFILMLARQHQDKGFEQQREARQPSGKVRLDQAHRTIGQFHARRAHLQIALMLEEVQVPVALGHCVVNRVNTLMTRDLKPTTTLEVNHH